MTKTEFIKALNDWGARKTPFLFIVDFEMKKPLAFPLDQLNTRDILFDIDGFSNVPVTFVRSTAPLLWKRPINFQEYREKFDIVSRHLNYGDSYLTNLTVKTEISLNKSLRELFPLSKARYKLFFKDEFLVFSPECFIIIKNGMIFSFPMKGTIDASLPDAAGTILKDNKELAEHVTIVDLIRNDLSQVAQNVSVTRFRYLEEIKTNQKNLLQVSSEIRGLLPNDYESHLGDILFSLLPAGSISGAPKPKTIDIILEAEKEKRGYYTGVFGYFDGKQLNSGVMIRFIEKEKERFFYRSGGGITTQSIAEVEFQEIIDKVYVPVD
jgi:para-aminobenzoate synthetase component I